MSLEHLVPESSKVLKANEAMSKGPGASVKCQPLNKLGTISASQRKMIIMDYSTLNLKKRDHKFM